MSSAFGVTGFYSHWRLWVRRVLASTHGAEHDIASARLTLPTGDVVVWGSERDRLRGLRLDAVLSLADLLDSPKPLDLLTVRPKRAEEEKP